MIVYFCCCVVAFLGRLFFLVKIFPKLFFNPHFSEAKTQGFSGLTILLCARNEAENLQQFLPKILSQSYPDFEVLVVNDRSTDHTKEVLMHLQAIFPHLRTLHITQTPTDAQGREIDGKKNALKQAILNAKHDLLLLTDADCMPLSDDWAREMVHTFLQKKDIKITLGISPYFTQKKSFLNDFIQYETLYTMLQYTGLAHVNMAYMGVGRNIMYEKSFFLEKKGLQNYEHIKGGDDDLWVNKAFEKGNVNVCFSPNAYIYSNPQTTWKKWFLQKRRHLSVASHYRPSIKLVLGLLHLSQLFFWVVGVWSFFLAIKYVYIWIIFGAIWWLSLMRLNQLYNMQAKNWLIPFFDFIFTFYIFVVGILARIPHITQWKN